jgi:peptidoglycan/xylan/chitin deacetylase (PgdA/CDA1 family)
MSAIKEIIGFCISIVSPPYSRSGSILMYHSIGVNDKFSTVTPKRFEDQLKYLTEKEYSVIPLEEMISRIQNKKSLYKCISITFDDGFEDFYLTVFPLLRKYEIPASLFVTTGYIGAVMPTRQGQKFRIVSEEQLKEMANSSCVALYPHTERHPKFSEISTEEAIQEINSSRQKLEGVIGKKANIFAYPFGNAPQPVVEYLRNHGNWLGAVTVQSGLVDGTTDLFLLNRNAIDSAVGRWQFRMKLSDGIVRFNKLKKWIRF